MSEIWTATERVTEKCGEDMLLFDVLDEVTKETRQEYRYLTALPLMFYLGGYPPNMGIVLAHQELPWRFRKHDNGHIYLDGPSIGDPSYHPIGETQEAKRESLSV